jgi:hypothetical protein
LDTCSNESAEAISGYIFSTLDKHEITSKCVACADNTNLNFWGVARNPGRYIFSFLKQSVNEEIIGVGCPAQILHNCLQHGADFLSVDVESIVLKIFNFFHIYAVRTQQLREFCDFVGIKYEELPRHSKTRWPTFSPAIEKILKMYPTLKGYFLSQPARSVPTIIQKFFEDELSELYLFCSNKNSVGFVGVCVDLLVSCRVGL